MGMTNMKQYLVQGVFLLAWSILISANQDCVDGELCNLIDQFEISMKMEGTEIDISWNFNQSEQIFGFQAVIYTEDKEIVYESPMLHQIQRHMKIDKQLNGKSAICVRVYTNSSHVLGEKCEVVEIKDLKIVIGILAGVIFIIPCIIGLSYVIYKDYRNANIDYEKLEKDSMSNHEIDIETNEKMVKEKQSKCKENLAFEAEEVRSACKCGANNSHVHKHQHSGSFFNNQQKSSTSNKKDDSTKPKDVSNVKETDITENAVASDMNKSDKMDSTEAKLFKKIQSDQDMSIGDLSGTHL